MRRIVIVAAFLVLAATIWVLSDVLLLIFGAVLLAVLLDAVAEPLRRGIGLGQGAALLLAGCAIAVVLATGIILFGSQVSAQLGQLFQTLPRAIETAVGEVESRNLAELLTGTAVGNLIATAYRWGTTLVGVLSGLLVVVFGGIYLSMNPAVYRNGLVLLFPPRVQPEIRDTVEDAGRALRRWLTAQLISMLVVGLMTTAGLWLIGLPSTLALGLIAGLADFIPIVGPVLAAVPALIVASSIGLEMVIWTLAAYVVVQQTEAHLILPLIVGNVVSIPPAVGLFAVIAMGVIFGPLGLLFAYPLAVVADVAIRRLYVRETLGEAVEIPGEKR